MSPAAELLRQSLGGGTPVAAMVLGSGLGDLAAQLEVDARIPFAAIPGFSASAVSGHAGEVILGRLGGRPVLVVSGRVHYYESGDPGAMRPVIAAIAELGIASLLLTNSAGSVRDDMAPGSVMAVADHIALSGMNPLIGEASDARFVGMTAAYDADLRAGMAAAAERLGEPLAAGVYMWFSGPSFETPAEIRMARLLGADAVGMSTVPETILARFFGLRVVAASVITNFGAGMTGAELSHAETKEMAPKGGARLSRIVEAMLREGVFDD
ncbi:purine-nucleoside phosphorylase [Jiella sonneratiae]|uniref:Purine nucleoside phosphorylase n=1 Tax=Jiella sonneratiae TaxID=2816856 RepID=A0ABS3J256_9HYPH|nr:purine-nucleoside phosphorylase [Jiella sonneratiae]MBO0903220.1 purine-nucleoside phosphorylase [Jiella sonneratiae]